MLEREACVIVRRLGSYPPHFVYSSTPPRAPAQDGTGASPFHSTRSSPVSSTSTVGDGETSPVLPPLPAPKLPGKASEYLRTPPSSRSNEGDRPYVTTSWGSPYPDAESNQFRRLSFSSETSEESPLHQLEINTPFLRPAPLIATTGPEHHSSSLSGSAAVLVNRVRRPLRGITEDWIRQHTTDDLSSEHRNWLSDGTDDSEHSSLRGSTSGDDASWFEEADPRTPRATVANTLHPSRASSLASRHHPRKRSSNETLKQAVLNRRVASKVAIMDALDVERGGQDAASIHTLDSRADTPRSDQPSTNGSIAVAPVEPPATPAKATKPVAGHTPRPKKKVPWKGKNILVCLPWDEERGQPGMAPVPLREAEVKAMLRSWEQLGYNIRGFDLEGIHVPSDPLDNYSQSRGQWPDEGDMTSERSEHKYQVTLPDLNAWKNYVNELNEAKLRALGVSFGDDEPAPPPSISPAASNMSRQNSNHYPPLPFSPPIPTSSANSNGQQPFPFHPPFLSGSSTQSPAIPSAASPASFNGQSLPGKFNPRASISISPSELPFHFSGPTSPHAWSPQMLLQQQLGRNGSPSVLNLNSLVSPNSPFQRDGASPPIGVHQRHQSLQYPILPHQYLHRQDSARPSPRLQELREVEEETQSNPYEEDKSPSKTPEPSHFIRHNASASLQKEIDDAEYHLEEQFRSQLEHKDYSPHDEDEKMERDGPVEEVEVSSTSHTRGPSVHFGNFGNDSDEGPKLHHPQPHTRGHSLSQTPYFDEEVRASTDEGSFRKHRPAKLDLQNGDNSYEIETNPSNLGTPIQSFDLVNQLHQHSFSAANNPWADVPRASESKASSRRTSHASKSSLSKLNAGAAEFKFNPTSSFTPSQFVFGGNQNAQPAPFQLPSFTPNPQSTTSSHFSVPSTSSSSKLKINASAPAFSPRKGEFSFSASGPKFNPDAPAFQPLKSFSSSVTSAGASGNEASEIRPTGIFGNIDLKLSEATKPTKKSKAIPIVRPASQHSSTPAPTTTKEQESQPADTNPTKKKFRENNDDGDDVPLFAEPTPEPEAVPHAQPSPAVQETEASENGDSLEEENLPSQAKADDDENMHVGDTTFASTILSESTDGKLQSESNDTKTTTSPSATSPDQDKGSWKPFEFNNETDIQDFNNARPFGDEEPLFKKQHKKSLSATAKPFVPGAFMFGTSNAASFDPVLKSEPVQIPEPEDEFEDDRAGSPTPGPDFTSAAAEANKEPESMPEPQAVPVQRDPVPFAVGLGSSRFASPPPAPKGLNASRFAATPSPPPKSAGLSASRYAATPSPVSDDKAPESPSENSAEQASEVSELHSFEPLPVSPPSDAGVQPRDEATHELTFEEIDAVMQHLNQKDPTMGVNRALESPKCQQPSPEHSVPTAAVTKSPPVQLPAHVPFRSDAPSPSPRHYLALPKQTATPRPSTELEDPFVDPPQSALSQTFDGLVHRLNVGDSLPESDWDDVFSASEQEKLEQRVQYFDGHVNDLVGSLLASRLDPLEKTLGNIHHVLGSLARRPPSSRRDVRSVSAEIQESDADDEDDEGEAPLRRSMSPRRDKKLEQIRIAVMDALNQQQATRALQAAQLESIEQSSGKEDMAILKAMEQMKEELSATLRLDFRGEDLQNIVEKAVERRMPPTPQPLIQNDEEANNKLSEMQSKMLQLEQRLRAEETRAENERSRVLELEQRLRDEEARGENEITVRRNAEDRAAELRRQLEQAETKVEVEIMNRSIFDQRIHDLEDRLKLQEDKTETEISGRRHAEDRLSEIQRLLRISSEEEDRLRAVIEERDQKIRSVEQASGKTSMRLALLEAAHANAEQTQVELKNRLNIAEVELRDARQEARHWRSEAEHARESAHRQADDLIQAVNESKHLHKLIDTLGVQLEENERIRDNWRAKFVSLQDDMAHAAREITEENARRTKKEQALLARQEVLDARLQAEARTRERLEAEIERLENGERAGLRAVGECRRLESLLSELRDKNHDLQQNALRYQREIQEARHSAADEVQRTQTSVQSELEAANNQVNVVREELEEEINKLRAQLDQVKMDADTARAHHEMMLEEAQTTKQTELEEAENKRCIELNELTRKHQNEVEDLQARYERQINNVTEDAQRTEQNLLERLSLSTSKTEHLQDRVAHLEDKVQIAQEAAKAAAQAASQASKSVIVSTTPYQPTPVAQTKQLAEAMQLPEKVSPQALRESIMVLQEQLQAREQRIEELEQTVSKLDPDSATKISKRDDEITWLRELLAVRHGDLQDIITALSMERLDREAVKDAAIRLKANLQMEEQERERAMNGGSAINLPNIAATIRGAATPRVAQAVGPLAAAWGSWRKSNQPTLTSLSSVLSSSPAQTRNSTPSKTSASSQSGYLSGLMTPPASGVRNTPPVQPSQPQPTAFGNTGRRYTAEQFANRSRDASMTSRQAEKMPSASTPPRQQERRQPVTPPMMRSGAYDSDARVEDFDDASFFDD
ncbi:uncharacterized protein F4807DRAFT_472736 [Annulohypoxylon truncatum]|uniref:uncharacterized protein n=1 Tax=Annulohypoxylon truncatum TaxID=327061 RepID=UPI002007EFC2|nr:uncharacterized protein F4807DRAFT_472736 [Annulohypoxylon truncatum]KAI1211839.1 hypothetical protein F4807DRAFT_472736 [Annulohypoxylon truncatum]